MTYIDDNKYWMNYYDKNKINLTNILIPKFYIDS